MSHKTGDIVGSFNKSLDNGIKFLGGLILFSGILVAFGGNKEDISNDCAPEETTIQVEKKSAKSKAHKTAQYQIN